MENSQTQVSSLDEFQKKALEAAEKELETLKAEVSSKKYLVDLNKEEIEKVKNFIKNDASWKFTESLGIIEAEKELNAASKAGKLFTTSVPIEAIYYYLSKVEGNGNKTNASSISTVDSYIKILKAFTSALEKIKIDNERLRNAEFVVAARREGIEPDSSVEKTEG